MNSKTKNTILEFLGYGMIGFGVGMMITVFFLWILSFLERTL